MATFAKSTFSASHYATFRPSYPLSLYTTILSHHRGPRNHAVDLGTGQGLVARALAPHFAQVTGVDPSATMLATADELTPAAQHPNVRYVAAAAEDAPLPAATVDLLAAAQAAHWFDGARFWPAAARAVRSGGTLALWCYMLLWFPSHPAAGEVVRRWAATRQLRAGQEMGELARYWPQPGSGICEFGMREVVPPEDDWEVLVRAVREPWMGAMEVEGSEAGNGDDAGYEMANRVKIGGVKSFMRTLSATKEWTDDHPGPEHRMRAEGGPGDVVDRMFDDIVEVEPDWADEEKEVDVTYGTAMIIARRR